MPGPPFSMPLSSGGSSELAPPGRALGLRGRPRLAQALAGAFDAIDVVHDAIEHGVGERGHADQLSPRATGTWLAMMS